MFFAAKLKYPFLLRGLAVVFLTFLLGSLCLLFLDYQRNSTLALLNKRFSYLNFVVYLNSAMVHSIEYNAAALRYVTEHVEHAKGDAAMQKGELAKSLALAESYVCDDPDRRAQFEHLRTMLTSIGRMHETYPGGIDALKDASLPEKLSLARFFFKNSQSLINDTLPPLEKNRLAILAESAGGGAAFDLQVVAGAAGFALAFLGLLSFLYFFYFGIRKRLSVLSSNCARLAKNPASLQPIEQADEFASLNNMLALVARSLMRASSLRSFLLCMITHDMRSPIMSASVNLDLAERSLSTDAGAPALAKASLALVDCKAFIDDLLLLEKAQTAAFDAAEEVLVEDLLSAIIDELEPELEQSRFVFELKPTTAVLNIALEPLSRAIKYFLLYLLAQADKGGHADRGKIPTEIETEIAVESALEPAHNQEAPGLSIVFRLRGEGVQAITEDIKLLMQGSRSLSKQSSKWLVAQTNAESIGASWRLLPGDDPNAFAVELNVCETADAASAITGLTKGAVAWRAPEAQSGQTSAVAPRAVKPVLASFMLLLSVPLIIQAVLFGGVFGQLKHAHKMQCLLNDQINALLAVNAIEVADLASAITSLRYATHPSAQFKADAIAAIQRNLDLQKQIAPLITVLPDAPAALVDLHKLTTEELATVSEEGPSKATEIITRANRWDEQEADIGARCRAIVNRDVVSLAVSVEKLNDENDQLKAILLLVAIVEVFIALVSFASLYFYFDHRFTSLVEAVYDLASRESEVRRRRGGDELSVFADALEKARAEIRACDQEVSDLLNLAAEELEKPVKASLAAIESLAGASPLSGFAPLPLSLPSPSALPVPAAESLEAQKQIVSTEVRQSLQAASVSLSLVTVLIGEMEMIKDIGGEDLKLDYATVDSAEVVAEACAVLSGLSQVKKVSVQIKPGAVRFDGDRSKILQVLMNIIANAVKFSPSGSAVEIETASKDGFAEIAVSDHGPGIGDDDLKRLFERFYQAQTGEKGRGFGIGLAVSKTIVDAHGGTLEVQTELGKGTKFTVRLPLKKE